TFAKSGRAVFRARRDGTPRRQNSGAATSGLTQRTGACPMNRLAEWFFAPAPATRLAAVRWLCLGFAVVYLLAAMSPLLRPMNLPRSSFQPVGVVSVLAAPLPRAVVVGAYVACVGAGVLATVGKWYRYSAPAFALLILWVTSYRNSWGMLFHNENLLVLHVAVLAFCPSAADVWTLGKATKTQ